MKRDFMKKFKKLKLICKDNVVRFLAIDLFIKSPWYGGRMNVMMLLLITYLKSVCFTSFKAVLHEIKFDMNDM